MNQCITVPLNFHQFLLFENTQCEYVSVRSMLKAKAVVMDSLAPQLTFFFSLFMYQFPGMKEWLDLHAPVSHLSC